ncbi:MAG TPA: GNAT family N-acetyltransferase [Polyangiaceae bacterium]|nr:GNAT family N-acetyltransferase [Polyangiaceae bacterium]
MVRRDDRLVAIAPWLIYRNDARRLVAFLAGGVSDYHDVLMDPRSAAEAFPEILRCLLRHRDQWDACDFEELAPWSMLRRSPVPEPFLDALSEGPPCPQLEVPPLSRPLATALPNGQWARFLKYRRRAERQGSLTLETAQGDGMDAAWADVFRLHRARWETRGLGGALGEQRLQTFHTDAALALAPICSSVDRVTLSGKTIAGLYGFVIEGVKYCYLQGIDPGYASLSPGLLLLGLVVDHSQQNGIERLDFLRGDEPYKLAWGATCANNARRQL